MFDAQLSHGGWPYSIDTKQGYPEPTCYSLLALAHKHTVVESQAQGLDWLEKQVDAQGVLTLAGDDEPNWAVSHLVLALNFLKVRPDLHKRTVNWLLDWKSNPIEPSPYTPTDGSLIGWPWVQNTFAWVEPTSYATLALKKSGYINHPRVTEAETLLLDRACTQGGWNMGNPILFERELEGFFSSTGAALLALQNLPLTTPEISKGLTFLGDGVLKLPSTLALALTILCFHAYGIDYTPYLDPLIRRQKANGSWRNMVQLTALATLALQSANGQINVFKI